MQITSIAEQLYFTTVKIDTLDKQGRTGSGTGFIFSYHHTSGDCLFIVTNKHVVMNMASGAINFIKGKDAPVLGENGGYHLRITDWENIWFGHPVPDVDIAITPLGPLLAFAQSKGVDLFYRCVTSKMAEPAELEKLDAMETVTFVGYPNGMWDSFNRLPIARRGHAATPLDVDFEGAPKFLIDASVFGGSSGSPVFIVNQGIYSTKQGNGMAGARLLFLGVIAAVYFRTQANHITAQPIPTHLQPVVINQEMIDLGIVFKARTVSEAAAAFFKSINLG